MTMRTLKSKLDKLAALQQEIDALADQADALKDQIKKELEARNLDELEAGDHIVRWKPVVSNKFDSKSLKAELPDIYNKFITQSEYKRFTLVSA